MIDIEPLKNSPGFEKFYRIPAVYYSSWLEKFGGTFLGKKVLDFGCGEGLSTAGISLFCGASSVTGVDIGDDFLLATDALKEISVDLNIPDNINFLKLLPSADLGDSEFDVIVSWSVLEHVSQNIFDLQMASIFKALKPNGYCVFQIAPLFYSAYGSHLYGVQEPWDHLTVQSNLLRERVYTQFQNLSVADNMWDCFFTLNKFIDSDFITRIQSSGLVVLDVYETYVDAIPNDSLLSIYSKNVLTKEQILLVCKK